MAASASIVKALGSRVLEEVAAEGSSIAAVEAVACSARQMTAAWLATVLVASVRSPAAVRVPAAEGSLIVVVEVVVRNSTAR